MANNKKVNEALSDMAGTADADHEVQMARAQLYSIAEYAIKLHDLMKSLPDTYDLESWQQAKITKAADYMDAVWHNLEYKINTARGGELGAEPGEIAVGESKKQEKKKYGKMKETSDPYMRKLRTKLKGAELNVAEYDDHFLNKHDNWQKNRQLKKKYSSNWSGPRGQTGSAAAGRGASQGSNKSQRNKDSARDERDTGTKAKPYYLAINNKVWWKNEQPVSFKTAQAASDAGHKMIRNNPDRLSAKNVKLTRNPNLGRG